MAPKTEATAPAKGPNLLLRKSLETQLAKCNKKALFHTNQANAYTAAAEDVQSAIDRLAQRTPTLFSEA
jgi:hypothetical protein